MKLKVGLKDTQIELHDAHVKVFRANLSTSEPSDVELVPFLNDEDSLPLKSPNKGGQVQNNTDIDSSESKGGVKSKEAKKSDDARQEDAKGGDIVYQAAPPTKTSIAVKVALIYTMGLSTYSGYHTIKDSDIAVNLLKNETVIALNEIKKSISELELSSNVSLSTISADKDTLNTAFLEHVDSALEARTAQSEEFGALKMKIEEYQALFERFSHNNEVSAEIARNLSDSLERFNEFEVTISELQGSVIDNVEIAEQLETANHSLSEAQQDHYKHINEVIAEQNRIIKSFTPQKIEELINVTILEHLNGNPHEDELASLRKAIEDIKQGHLLPTNSQASDKLAKRQLTEKILTPVNEAGTDAEDELINIKEQMHRIIALEESIQSLRQGEFGSTKLNRSLIEGIESRQTKLENSLANIVERFDSVDISLLEVSSDIERLTIELSTSNDKSELNKTKIAEVNALLASLEESVSTNINTLIGHDEELTAFVKNEESKHEVHEKKLQDVAVSINSIMEHFSKISTETKQRDKNIIALSSDLAAIQEQLIEIREEGLSLREDQLHNNRALKASIEQKNAREEQMLSLIKDIVEKVY